MKRLLAAVALAAAFAAPAKAQISSSLTYSDGSAFFDLCADIGCAQSIDLNTLTSDVLVTAASGVFDPVLDPGLEGLLNPLPRLDLVRTSATEFTLDNNVIWSFDGTPEDGTASAVVGFLAGSIFTASQESGAGGVLSSSLAWQFDASKLAVGVFGGLPAGTLLETGSFTLNSSRNSLGETVAAYGVTVQTVSPAPPTVPGPLGIAGAGAALAWARRLRRRIKAAGGAA